MKKTIKTSAKINLSLLIYSPRNDGLHPICSVFQKISLFDTLNIETTKKKTLVLTCNNQTIETEDNIITKIYNKFKNKLPFGLKVNLSKNIPIGAGLGGGSSNAAGFLQFLNKAAKLNFSEKKLVKVASFFGADVPFFLNSQTAIVRGIGNKITQIESGPYRYFVLIYPNIAISTKDIYNTFDKKNTAKKIPGRTPKNISKYHLGQNDLKDIAFGLYPKLQTIEQKLIELNAPPLHMSGSGSTLFIPFKKRKDALAWEEKIKKIYPKYLISFVKSV
jgi:4-diphosphocytidyl-2-C-methyl-D-erythritol kinase